MSTELTMTAETLLAMGIAHYDQCENAQQQAVVNAAKSGMYFLEAKAKMKHGEFMPKIALLRADISHSKINKYMQLSKEMPELLNSDARPNLNYAQAIALMSAPEELKTEIVERIDNGEEISSREIQRLKKEAADLEREKQSILDNLAGANNEIAEKQKRVNWLEIDRDAFKKQNDDLRNLIDVKVSQGISEARAANLLFYTKPKIYTKQKNREH